MILITFISALVLIESREVFQGLISQPFVTALFLVWAGYDQNLILASAALTHLIYLNHVPSGAALYPEYPFGFFITVSYLTFNGHNPVILSAVIPIIIIVSAGTANFVAFKRRFFEKHRDYLLFFKGRPNILKGLVFSFLISIIYSFLLGLLLKLADLGLKRTALRQVQVPSADNILILLCLIPAIFYAYKTLRLKK